MGPGHSYEIFSLIKLDQLSQSEANSEVNYETLYAAGVATKQKQANMYKPVVKVVGGGDPEAVIPKGLTVKAHAFTATAKAAIEAAGGTCVYLSKTTQEVLEMA